MKKFLLIASFLLCFFVAGERAEGKSVSWASDPFIISTDEAAEDDRNVYLGLSNVLYESALIDQDGNVIDDNSILNVGKTVKIVPRAFNNGDISWFITGSAWDSPYGYWRNNAENPINCGSTDYSCRSTWYSETGSMWQAILHSVNQPFISYNFTGTAGLDCFGDSCLITSPGTINAAVSFSDTYGKFYTFQSWDLSTGEHFNTPVYGTMFSGDFNAPGYESGEIVGDLLTAWSVTLPIFTLPIPAQTISFTLTAVSNNNLPTTPTVTPQPFTGLTNTAYPFSFTSTDPDNDNISYEVDWNNDSLYDESTPFGASGASQILSNVSTQWITEGTVTFQVRAKDSNGGYSAWATPSVTLSSVSNGVCGPATLVPFGPAPTIGLCTTGTNTLVSQSGTNWTWGCNGSGGGTSTLPNACTTPVETYTLSAERNPLGTGTGTITDTIPTATSIDSALGRNSEDVSYNASRTLRANPTSSSISWSGCSSVSGNDCTVSNITSDQTVTATFTRLPEPGVCGPSDGASFATLDAGSSGLCTSGAVDSFSLSGTTYSWNCNGMMGSPVNDACFATQTRDYNWREVSP